MVGAVFAGAFAIGAISLVALLLIDSRPALRPDVKDRAIRILMPVLLVSLAVPAAAGAAERGLLDDLGELANNVAAAANERPWFFAWLLAIPALLVVGGALSGTTRPQTKRLGDRIAAMGVWLGFAFLAYIFIASLGLECDRRTLNPLC